MKKLIISAFAAVMSVMAFAQTYTWVGAAGGSWQTATNWQVGGSPASGAPTTGCDLLFPGDASVTQVPTISVGAISLGGAVELSYSGTFTVEGIISGSGSLKMIGDTATTSSVHLKNSNTFEGGYENYGGCTYLYTNTSLGNGDAKFVTNGKPANACQIDSAITIANNLTFGSAASSWSGPLGVGASVTFAGEVTFTDDAIGGGASACRIGGSGAITFKKPVKKTGNASLLLLEKSVVFEDSVSGFGNMDLNAWSCHIDLNQGGCGLNGLEFRNCAYATFNINAPNIFPPTAPGSIVFGGQDGTSASSGDFIVDLHGNSQVVKGVYSNQSKTFNADANFVVKSTDPATITMTNEAAYLFTGHFDGAISLVWDSPSSYQLTKFTSTTTGGVYVKRKGGWFGVLSGGFMPNISEIRVASGATFYASSAERFNHKLKRLVLTEGAILELPSGTEFEVDEYVIVDGDGNEVVQPGDSVYTLKFDGKNDVVVRAKHREQPSVTKTWDAGGSDSLFTTVENWDNDETPDFGGMNAIVTFANGNIARANVDAAFKGLVFGSSAFGIQGEKQISLYEAGIVADGGNVYSISTPISGAADSQWVVGAGSRLEIAGECAVVKDKRVFVTGKGSSKGTVAFSNGSWSGEGSLVLSNITSVVSNSAFSGANTGKLVLCADGLANKFCDATVDCPVDVLETPDSWGSWNVVATEGNTIFNGLVSVYVHALRTSVSGTTTFKGGLKIDNYYIPRGSGVQVFDDTPIDVSYVMADAENHVVLKVPHNKVKNSWTLSTENGSPSELFIATDNAFDSGSIAMSSTKEGREANIYLDGYDHLTGHDLEISNFSFGTGGSIRSSQPGRVITTTQKGNKTTTVAFKGVASYWQKGVDTGDATVTFSAESDTAGSLEVSAGTVVIAQTGRWSQVSEVTVSGGTLQLDHGKALGKNAELKLKSGQLVLNNTNWQVVKKLYLGDDETAITSGTWGAPGNRSAEHTDSRISGSGLLFVGKPGIALIVR